MKIGDTHIIVPQDETGDWPANWRSEVASAVASEGIDPPNRQVAEDPWITKYATYMQLDMDYYEGEVPDPTLKPYHVAATWYGNPDINSPRFKIEPLLLTGMEYPVIAQDMGVSEESIKVYEKLYFNTRNDDGTLQRGCYNRSRLAFNADETLNEQTGEEVIWRVIGFSLGYSSLVQLWHWERDAAGLQGTPGGLFDEMWRFAQAGLLNRIVRNQMSSFDLNNMMGNYVQDQRMKYDTKKEAGDALQGVQIALGMLQICRPHVHEAAKTVDGKEGVDQTENIQAKLAQQRMMAGEKLTTSSGAGAAAIDEMIRESADLLKLEK